MKRKRCIDGRFISILEEHKAGESEADLFGRHAVAQNSIYRWKATYVAIGVADGARLSELEAEVAAHADG